MINQAHAFYSKDRLQLLRRTASEADRCSLEQALQERYGDAPKEQPDHLTTVPVMLTGEQARLFVRVLIATGSLNRYLQTDYTGSEWIQAVQEQEAVCL